MNESELARDPKNLGLPKGFDWPKAVKKEVEVWDAVYAEWSEAQTVLYEKAEAVREAERADAKALVDAVAAGKPDPGTKATEKAKRERLYVEEVVRQARSKADNQASKTWAAIQANRADILREANRMAIAGAEGFDAEVKRLQKEGQEMLQRRHEAYAGLRFASRLTGGNLNFDPSFPLDGDVKMPRTHEGRVYAIVTLLEKLLERWEKGEAA